MNQVYYIHVDSKNRDSNLYPGGNNFVLHLSSPIKGVKKVDLVSAKVPNSMYNLTNGTNVISTSDITVSLDPGFYSAQLVESEIAKRLNVRENIKYLQAEGKFIYLTNDSTSFITVNTSEMAKILGFNQNNTYTVQPLNVAINGFSYGVKSIRVVDLSINEYVFLDIEEFRTPFFEDAKSLPISGSSARNMFAAIPMDVPSTHIKTFKENLDFYTGINVALQNLSRLTIHWYDKDLKPLNFQGFENNAFILRVHTEIVTESQDDEHDVTRETIDKYIQEVKNKIEEETVKKPEKKSTLGKWFVILIILSVIAGIYVFR